VQWKLWDYSSVKPQYLRKKFLPPSNDFSGVPGKSMHAPYCAALHFLPVRPLLSFFGFATARNGQPAAGVDSCASAESKIEKHMRVPKKKESGAHKVRAWICQAPENRSDGVKNFFPQVWRLDATIIPTTFHCTRHAKEKVMISAQRVMTAVMMFAAGVQLSAAQEKTLRKAAAQGTTGSITCFREWETAQWGWLDPAKTKGWFVIPATTGGRGNSSSCDGPDQRASPSTRSRSSA